MSGNVVEITVKVDDKTAAGSASVERSLLAITTSAKAARTALAGVARNLNKSFENGEKAREAFARVDQVLGGVAERAKGATDSLGDVNRKVREIGTTSRRASKDVDTLGGAGKTVGDSVSSAMQGAASSAAGLGTQLMGTVTSLLTTGVGSTIASGGINTLVLALVAAAAAAAAAVTGFIAMGPALLALGGFAGAAMSILAGLAVAIATVKIGLGGIGGALSAYGKSSGGGGGGGGGGAAQQQAEAQARAVAAASRAYRDAKLSEVDAIKAVNQARRDEIERLQDLQLALRGASIGQKEAKQALAEATEKNRRAQIAGSAWEKAEAANAVERAQYQYDSVSEKLEDLAAEKRKAAKDGVEGSDQVQKALDNEKKAHERTVLAAEALAVAKQKVATASAGAAGGVNAFNEAMKKLSPNARELVYALIDIQKRFEHIKRAVQDRFLEGWAEASTKLYNQWEKHLLPMLGKMADHFNKMGLAIMKALGDSAFIKNIEKASDAFGGLIDHLTVATTKFIDSFGILAGASTPVLEKIGELIERIFTKFNNWIRAAEDSGALKTFMEDAATTLQDIYDIAGLAFGIMMDFIYILFPGSKIAGEGVLNSIKEDLAMVKDWLGDPANQEKLKKFFLEVGKFFDKLVNEYIPAITDFGRHVGGLVRAFNRVANGVKAMDKAIKRATGSAIDSVIAKGNRLVSWARALPGRMRGALSRSWDGLKDGFRNSINWIIDKWNGLSFQLPTIMGGGQIGLPQAPRFASGGVTGKGWSEINERGREMVKLPTGSLVMPHANTQNAMMNSGGQGGQITLKSSGQRIDDLLMEILRTRISAEGGNVQVVLGSGRG